MIITRNYTHLDNRYCYFVRDRNISKKNDTIYEGNLRDIEGLKKWFMEVSKYFIREEIMEEKKTLLILFRVKAKHADYETLYVNVIRNELMGKKGNISLFFLKKHLIR